MGKSFTAFTDRGRQKKMGKGFTEETNDWDYYGDYIFY